MRFLVVGDVVAIRQHMNDSLFVNALAVDEGERPRLFLLPEALLPAIAGC